MAVILLPLAFAPFACRQYADNTPQPTPVSACYPEAVANPLPTGTVRGRVVWQGELPAVPSINGLIDTPDGAKWGEVTNPFAPSTTVDGGLAGVVVWLSPVDPGSLKPWPYPALVVEHAEGKLRSVQAGVSERLGFVKLGDEVEVATRGEGFRLIRARGVAFFTLTFPKPEKPRKRKLTSPGVVEFTSAGGDFWNAMDVVVCEHPYYTATDADGQFELAHVPPGEYELNARVRSWVIADRDRDPETGRIMRLRFAEPVRVVRRVSVPGNEPVQITVNTGQFVLPPG